jgi:hypothetical protein
MKYLLSSILLFLLSFNYLYAQQKADFSGTYAINKSKINFGSAPDYILPVTYKVVQGGDKLAITTTLADMQGNETSYTENLVFGAGASETLLKSGLKRSASVSWSTDKSAFTVVSNSISDDGKQGSKITAMWSLIDGGKTLFIDRNVEQVNGLKYNIKGYYDRN